MAFLLSLCIGTAAHADTLLTYRRTVEFSTKDGRETLKTEDGEYTIWAGTGRFRWDDGRTGLIYRKDSGKAIVLDHRRRSFVETPVPGSPETWPRLAGLHGEAQPATKRETGETKKVREWAVSRTRIEETRFNALETDLWTTEDIAADVAAVRRLRALLLPEPSWDSRFDAWEAQLTDFRGVPVSLATRSIAPYEQIRQVAKDTLQSAKESDPPPGLYDPPASYRREPTPEKVPAASLSGSSGFSALPLIPPVEPPDQQVLKRLRAALSRTAGDNASRPVRRGGAPGFCYRVVDLGKTKIIDLPFNEGGPSRLTDSGCYLYFRTLVKPGYRNGDPDPFVRSAAIWKDGQPLMVAELSNGSDFVPSAINASCQAVGSGGGDEPARAFLWSGGERTALGTLGGKSSQAVAINDRGQIVGDSDTATGERHAFLWDNGSMRDLGTLGGKQSGAMGVNARGQVVGWSATADRSRHAFLWSDGRMIDLGTAAPGPIVINGDGRVAWQSELGGVYWDGSRKLLLPVPPATGKGRRRGEAFLKSVPIRLDDAGRVLGHTDDFTRSDALLWEDGKPALLQPFGNGGLTKSGAMNREGVVVGRATPGGVANGDPDKSWSDARLFLWKDGDVVDLEEETCVPSPWDWSRIGILEINSAGWMAGVGRDGSDEDPHNLLLIPPEGMPYPEARKGAPGGPEAGASRSPSARSAAVLLKSVHRALSRDYVDNTFRGLDWDAARDETLAKVAPDAVDPYRAAEELVDRLQDPDTRFYRPGEAPFATGELSPRVLHPAIRLRRDPVGGLLFVAGLGLRARAIPRGVAPGDELVSIDGVPVKGMGLSEAERRLGGPPGTALSLRLRYDGAEVEGTVERLPDDGPTVLSRRIASAPGAVGYLHTVAFDRDTDRELRAAVVALEKDGIAAFLLDLRGNPGGDFDAALAFARAWVDTGPIATARLRNGEATTFDATDEAVTAKPLVVLVDETTSGSAEMVAAALQESGRAKVVGGRTAGTAALVRILPLAAPGGEPATITYRAGSVRSPKGRDLFGGGVEPDLVVVPTAAERRATWSDPSKFGSEGDMVAGTALETIGREMR